MPLEKKVQQGLEQALAVVDEHGTVGPRLVDDATRLFKRVQRLLSMSLVASGMDLEALELACYAIQLPMRRPRTVAGRMSHTSLKDRAEEAAELLLGVAADADEQLLDRTARLLHEMPHRSPMLDEARILADALNLEDFGITGLLQQAIQASQKGEGVAQVSDGQEKREAYGYWQARLKDGFHFEPVRQIAQRRLDNARHAAMLLQAELREDRA